jgi:hypothetical protein
MKTPASFFGHDLMWGAYFTAGHLPDPATFGLARLHDSGVSWNEVHLGPGQFKWTTLDQIVDKLPGKEIDYCFARTPQWASMRPNEPAPCGGNLTGCGAPPKDVDTTNAIFKEFVTAIVTRYKGRIKLWEGWNEANGAYKGAFWTGTIPQLVRMQSDAYGIIKSIDPNAFVAGPSVDGESNQFQWLDSYLASGGAKFQDAVTFHAYLHDLNPDPAPTLTSWLAQFRALMAKHGISNQELWETEGSWAHGTLGAGPLNSDQQVAYLQQMMILCWAAGVARFVWYSYDNLRTAFLWNGQLTPAGKAYAELYTWLVGAECTQVAAKASDGTWTVVLTLADGTAATISWKPQVKPILTTHGGTTMGNKTFNFPVPAVTPPPFQITEPGVLPVETVQPPPVQPPPVAVATQFPDGDSADLVNNVIVFTAGGGPPPPQPTINGVTVTGLGQVAPNGMAQFAANVQGTGNYDHSVTWSASAGTISPAGSLTAPASGSVVVTATSVGDPTVSGSTTIQVMTAPPPTEADISPSGGDDTATLQHSLNANTGKTVRMLAGKWSLSPIAVPSKTTLILDGALVNDRPGYGGSTCMFNMIGVSDVTITGVNGAKVTMTNSFQASMHDGAQWRHTFVITAGCSNIKLSGLVQSGSGGDGYYCRQSTNVVFEKLTGTGNYRNACSITGQVKGLWITDCVLTDQMNRNNAHIADGIDFEGNSPADFYQDCHIINCDCSRNQERGIEVSCYFLDRTTVPCDVEVKGCKADNCGVNGFQTHQAGSNGPVKITLTQSGNTINGQQVQFVQS